ncbi:hypothetical protein [Paenibacillus antibioticophila]|uniref:hypothetical protein n=1 Tax=Paenibacillus antibioticophila TaxID=1274374 RepID=UPI0005C85FEC|nr:hypothetical protein [Paenibacillus antibioticophila]
MTDIIKENFLKKAVIYDNIWLYFIKTAIAVVYDCEKNGIAITAIEAFKLTGEGIQPSQEHSVFFNPGEDNWSKAIDFLSNIKDTSYLYEIWYEGY